MAVFNLGSINLDLVYRVPHLPAPGETLASLSLERGLGGKGANQSVALAKAGADVRHIGAIGADSVWLKDQLADYGVNIAQVGVLDVPTGHAVIYVDQSAENSIVLHKGANHQIVETQVAEALANANKDDWLLIQNETSCALEACKVAKSRGMKIAYAAAPFDLSLIEPLLDQVDLLAVNQIEAEQMHEAYSHRLQDFRHTAFLVTKGGDGADYLLDGKTTSVDAFAVDPVDTTGAGDTFLGFFLAGLDKGDEVQKSLRTASAAAALQVTAHGAASAIPDLETVETLLLEASI